ncbi:MAG: hypothetical protein K2X63_02875 [Burkholderiaceae bacterium]|nr:hypothetical protein [Burkholderiaceae bacterium]
MYPNKKGLHPRRILIASAIAIAFCTLSAPLIATAQSEIDPPSRVAHLSYVRGTPSFTPADSDEWAEVNVNRPFTTGDSLWIPEAARAELHIGSTAFRLNEQSSLSFEELSDDAIQVKLTRGTLIVRVRELPGQDNIEINTPNLAFVIQEPGEYRINVNEDGSTELIIRRGAGVAYGNDDSLTLRNAERVLFSGTNLTHSSIDRVRPYDDFDQWASERDRQEDNSVSAQFVSREVIGYQQLDQYGAWETSAEYGAIWYPRHVANNWSPYRDGNWVWVAPWGWTWVDRAPWGFAPYHYGRWAHIGRRWAWVPGEQLRRARPVYAPALVSFVGQRGGSSVSININNGRNRGPAVAWFPLAPGEVYRPGYHSSARYLQNMNRIEKWHQRDSDNDHYVHRNQSIKNAVTAVPVNTFIGGRSVKSATMQFDPKQIHTTQNNVVQINLAPSKESTFAGMRHVERPKGDPLQRPVVSAVPQNTINSFSNRNDRNNGENRFDKDRRTPPQQERNANGSEQRDQQNQRDFRNQGRINQANPRVAAPAAPATQAAPSAATILTAPSKPVVITTPNVPTIPVAPPPSPPPSPATPQSRQYGNDRDVRDLNEAQRRPAQSTRQYERERNFEQNQRRPNPPTTVPTLTAPVTPAATIQQPTVVPPAPPARPINNGADANEAQRRSFPARPTEREPERYHPRQVDTPRPANNDRPAEPAARIERQPVPEVRRPAPTPPPAPPSPPVQAAPPAAAVAPPAPAAPVAKPEKEHRGRAETRESKNPRINEK